MEVLTGVFTAFGLSASAGLNAYIPLLVIALLSKYVEEKTIPAAADAKSVSDFGYVISWFEPG
mgnify:CR=1 FL=1